jgi:DNA-binding transcriptional ArsR family regulator
MDTEKAASCLAQLGNPTRLRIFRLLVQAGNQGLPVGALQSHLDIPASTLSHHIGHLVRVGLADQTREGRVLRCTPNYMLMTELVGYLTAECCLGVELPATADAA